MIALLRFSSLLWVLMWQISIISCMPSEFPKFSENSFNLNITHKNVTTPKNLSELIEFLPLDVPVELENETVLHGFTQDVPKIITVKLKTHVIVENQHSNNQTGFLESNEEIKIMKPSESSDALSDIEYFDTLENETQYFFNHRAHSRKARMSSFSKHTLVPNTSGKELNLFKEKIPNEDSEENHIDNRAHLSMYATGRQYVFHPYLPYGKDVAPDEKISFHDILPIKMVKFIKSMVEEADWNGMFKSMVRTVVDHFVNKIIEKMFTEKHDDLGGLRKRSFDVLLTPAFVLPTFRTPVARLKRTVSASNSPGQEEDMIRFLSSKRKAQEIDEVKKKSPEERMTWLDHFLDFVFPNSKSNESEAETFERLKKRDTTNSQLFKVIISFFLNTFEKSSEILTDAKDILRYKMLKEFLPYIYQKRFINNPVTSSNSIDEMKMTHRKFSKNLSKPNDITGNVSDILFRRKRSTSDTVRKDEDRLWQTHSRRHRPHNNRFRDECSLRRACNAGRLLSRLPSVQDITLQLRSNGNEPHWDALIWGMKKKRCSRIFCKRPRSPKGSKYLWHSSKERASKRVVIVTEAPEVTGETDNLTV